MKDDSDRAFLFFSLGPVQTFIASARTVRDLWTGSFLLAWLTRHAIEAVEDRNGVELITPILPPELTADNLKAPSVPNRFIAEVPAGAADELAEAVRSACLGAWGRLCGEVQETLAPIVTRCIQRGAQELDNSSVIRQRSRDWPGSWDRLWAAQVGIVDGQVLTERSPFDVRVHVVPAQELTKEMLQGLLPDESWPKDGSHDERLWSASYDYVWRLAGVAKLQRSIPRYQAESDQEARFPAKCSLLGTYEQMGPAELEESRHFWQWLSELDESAVSTFARRTDPAPGAALCDQSGQAFRLAGPLLRPHRYRRRPTAAALRPTRHR